MNPVVTTNEPQKMESFNIIPQNTNSSIWNQLYSLGGIVKLFGEIFIFYTVVTKVRSSSIKTCDPQKT